MVDRTKFNIFIAYSVLILMSSLFPGVWFYLVFNSQFLQQHVAPCWTLKALSYFLHWNASLHTNICNSVVQNRQTAEVICLYGHSALQHHTKGEECVWLKCLSLFWKIPFIQCFHLGASIHTHASLDWAGWHWLEAGKQTPLATQPATLPVWSAHHSLVLEWILYSQTCTGMTYN